MASDRERRAALGPPSPRHALIALPAYRSFWSARTLSYLGDTMASVALVVLAARQQTGLGAAWAVSALLLAQTVPQTLGPFVGIVADWVDKRRLLIGVNVAQAGLAALIAIPVAPFPVTLLLVAALFLLATILLPASQSVLPSIIPTALLGEANAWLRLGLNVGLAAGPAIAGLLLLVAGTPAVLLLDAGTFVIAALLLAGLPPLSPSPQPRSREVTPASPRRAQVWRSLRAGFRYLRQEPVARTVTLGLFLTTLFVAVDNVGLIFLARSSFHAGAAGYSFLLSAWGIGMIAGPLALVRLVRRLPVQTLYWLCTGVMGAATLLCGLAPTVFVAALCQLVVGVSNGMENISYDTLLQRAVRPDLRGRVFGAVYSAPYLALLITYSAGGILLGVTSPRVVFVIGGAGTMAAAALLWLLLAQRLGPPRVVRSQPE